MKTAVITVRIPENMLKDIDSIASAQLRKRANVVFMLLSEALAKYSAEIGGEE